MNDEPDPNAPHEWELAIHAASEVDTDALGRALAAALAPGMVVALVGNLGAGKTRLVRSIVSALGIDPRHVSSPTFVLIHEYDAATPVFHFDTYRLRSLGEWYELGAEEMMASDGICLIEWADRVASALPADRLEVDIEATGPTSRRFLLRALGPRAAQALSRLKRSA